MTDQQQQPTQAIALPLQPLHEERLFALKQREAKAIAASTMVPKEYQGNISNVIIAMEIAERLGASIFAVMQNLDIIHGRPSWRATFLIATVNTCGRFTALRYRFVGEPGKPSWGCCAVATDRETGDELVGEVITIKMANDEGWATKSGSKWKTMPGQMLRYRAAAFWTRVYAPELSLGMHTAEEVEDFTSGTTTVSAEGPRSGAAAALSRAAERAQARLEAPVEPDPESQDEPVSNGVHDPVTGEVHELPDEFA